MPRRDLRRLRLGLTLLGLIPAGFAVAGPPFTTDDPEPAPEGHFEIYLYSDGIKTRDGFEASLPGFEVNYGAGKDLQLAIAVDQSFEAPESGPSSSHYGATELGVKYRFVHEDEDGWRPQIAFYPSVEIPDGAHQSSVFLPVWLQKSIGEWEVFGGGGPRLDSGDDRRDVWVGGIAALHPVTANLDLGVELFHETVSSKRLRGTSGFNLAGLYAFNETWHLVASAGRGLNDIDSSNQFSYYVGIELTPP